VSRQFKKAVSKKKRIAVISKLEFDLLEGGDWSVICAALIHEREAMLAEAEFFSFEKNSMKDAVRVATFRDKARRVNDVLVKLNHPGAIKGPVQ